MGIHAFNNLIVIRFALSDPVKARLTPEYSYALETNFRPWPDYGGNLRAMHQPCQIVAGADDEVFYADRFAEVCHASGKDVPVELLPGVDHIQLTLAPAALAAEVKAVQKLQGGKAQ